MASPIGRGTFVSYWSFQRQPSGALYLSKIPFIGSTLARKIYPQTMYHIDVGTMYLSYVHQAITVTVDQYAKHEGVAGIPDDKRTPIMHDPFDRIT